MVDMFSRLSFLFFLFCFPALSWAQEESLGAPRGVGAVAPEDVVAPPSQVPISPPINTEDYIYSADRIAVWLDNFRTQALEAKVSATFFDKAFENFKPEAKVVAAANFQPEFKTPPGEYIEKMLSPVRISKGKKMLYENANTLEKLERLYGVDRHILVAIWGIETNYGTTMGGHHVVYALATLAIEGNRKVFAEKQLLALLPILEKEGLPIDSPGSWAGAMGQMQFIPTTYADYARDVDGDGKRDIWHSLEDSLGSAAYYLKRSGWVSGMFWGIEVETPKEFQFDKQEDKQQKIANWFDEGYQASFGTDARHKEWYEQEARLVKIKPHTPAFLVTKNFKALLKYNNASIYALAVGLLADRLRGAHPTKTAWLKVPLEKWTKAEIEEIQSSLNQLGFDSGEIDGIIGRETLQAFHAWQASRELEKSKPRKKEVAALHKQAKYLNRDEIKELQQTLTALGFDAGTADGLVGQRTRTALRAFQQNAGFIVNGDPTRAMLIALSEKVKEGEAEQFEERTQNDSPAEQPKREEQSEPTEE